MEKAPSDFVFSSEQYVSEVSSADDDDPDKTDKSESSNTDSRSHFSAAEVKKEQELVREETLAVRRIKIAVLIAILLSGIGGTIVTYYLVRQSEQDSFLDEFDSFAHEIDEISANTASQIFAVIKSLSKSITASTLETNNSYPFVTLPYFFETAEDARAISGAEIIAIAPLVKTSLKEEWEAYANANQGWIKEGLKLQGKADVDPGFIPETIYGDHKHKEGQLHYPGYHLPLWQITGAPINSSVVNMDLFTKSSFEHASADVIEIREGILSDICDFSYLTEYSYELFDDELAHPQSYILEPIYDSFVEGANVSAFVVAILPWNNFFKNIFPENVEGVHVVIDDKCGDIHTYLLNGPKSTYVGFGDRHDPTYNYLRHSSDFAVDFRFHGSHPTDGSVTFEGANLTETGQTYEEAFGQTYSDRYRDTSKGHCEYELAVYPSSTLQSSYTTNEPVLYCSAVAIIFGFIFVLICIYDRMVLVRQRKLMATAERTKAIVGSLFPANVQERLLGNVDKKEFEKTKAKPFNFDGNKSKVSDESEGGTFAFDSKPIADFFPNTTIMFADLAGFTAWSSTREPAHVFSLLETIYRRFDEIARSKGVFKVETVGDCYVAATGLPDPCKNHAEIMAAFARTCLHSFHKLVRRMEIILGPDTADLGLRIGIHSGPVTGGVLRGEKSRFQLFGDTMNTAARIESTGEQNKIQLSQETADLLKSVDLGRDVTMRGQKVSAKGKGEIQTYWLSTRSRESDMNNSRHGNESIANQKLPGEKETRMIKWNYQNLRRLLQVLVAKNDIDEEGDETSSEDLSIDCHGPGEMVLDEVKEFITLPQTASKVEGAHRELAPEVDAQLYDLVQSIAGTYNNNPFHCFEHASHVSMSVTKLLSRIVAPDSIDYDTMKYEDVESNKLHNFTYGITSDPLTPFACAFAALIHDADHLGVPNATLVEENHNLAKKYKGQSVAEQNSVDLTWNILMQPTFRDLRSAIVRTQSELQRFRQLVVNCVMATDIVNKEQGALRKKRWEKAFSADSLSKECSPENFVEASNRKATIVIEHLIQASDVAHTMQHWHVYLKWNERLFRENYKAFKDGKAATDPSENWYQGEIGFFDFYIIPLAKKLKDCGVFGVSSDEYLDYAMHNRHEWSIKGKDVVALYLAKLGKKEDKPRSKRGSIDT